MLGIRKKLFCSALAFAIAGLLPAGGLFQTGALTAYAADAQEEEKNVYENLYWEKAANGKSVTITGHVADAKDITELTIPDEIEGLPVTAIGVGAFSRCTNLKTIHFSDNVTLIDSSAFSYCSSIEELRLPLHLTTIGYWAFYQCPSIYKVVMPDYDNLAIYSHNFSEGSVTTIVYPEGVVKPFAPNSWYNRYDESDKLMTNVTHMEMPSTIQAFTATSGIAMNNSVNFTGVESITVAEGNANFCSIDGVVYSKDKTKLVVFPGAKRIRGNDGWGFLPAECSTIGNGAFYNNKQLVILELPDQITRIEGTNDSQSGAFYGCSNLEEVRLSDQMELIGKNAFSNCTALHEVSFGLKGASYVFEGAYMSFSGTSILRTLTVSEGAKQVDESIFDAFSSTVKERLTSLNLPASLETLPLEAIGGMTELAAIHIADDNPAFYSVDGVVYQKPSQDGLTAAVLLRCPRMKKSFAVEDANISAAAGAFEKCTDVTVFAGSDSAIAKQLTGTAVDGVKLADLADYCQVNKGYHSYDAGVVKKAATLTAEGIYEYTCTACGESRQETIPYPKSIVLGKSTYSYNGKARQPAVKVMDSAGKTVPADQYRVSYRSNTNAGTAQAVVAFQGGRISGKKTLSFVISKLAQPMKVTVKNKNVSVKKVQNTNQVVSGAVSVGKAEGAVTYTKAGGASCLTVAKKTGKITVKKGTKKGKYQIKIKITAKGNGNYQAGTVSKTVKVVVK